MDTLHELGTDHSIRKTDSKMNQLEFFFFAPACSAHQRMPPNASPGQQIWDTRGSAAGTYMVELYNAGKLVDAQRVVIKP